jgi:tRNA threonylcarbamoyladenosine biosynthesis protein TsaB
MILFLDTSTPTCALSLVEGDWRYDASWEAGRGLAKGLLEYLESEIASQGKVWGDVSGLVVFKGPGSFTGLRIGVTVMNTLASANSWPIIGATGDNWQQLGIQRIEAGENDEIVLPEYGGEANITTPKK